MRGVGGDVRKKGYHVAEINRSGTYPITDGGSQAWAIVTQRGVILVDVPETLLFRRRCGWRRRSPR